ncbi:MAG: hypothetical protein JNN07_06945 [Verrucomicrobiales bacterium]|nr:hypothetical protein [Verrucomicrobiales bacterium]
MNTSPLGNRHAVIDIGTNSVKLLVADLGQVLRTVVKESRHTLLGEGLFSSNCLQPAALARTVGAVQEFTSQALRSGASTIRILATSATREATNSVELVRSVRAAVGLEVEIISGDREADYVFQGVTSEPCFANRPVLIVDVGGGSTEWSLGEGRRSAFRLSTLLGTARFLQTEPPSDPPTNRDLVLLRRRVREILRVEVKPNLDVALASFGSGQVRLVGLGGAVKTLARLVVASGDPCAAFGEDMPGLTAIQIREQVERIWSLRGAERRCLAGVPPEKADILLVGAVIYEMILAELGFSELFMSERGLRHGAVLNPPTPVFRPGRSSSPMSHTRDAGSSVFPGLGSATSPQPIPPEL